MELNHFKNLYTPEDIATMKVADSARMQGKNRIEEIRNYAKLSGVKRIGIANCAVVQKEAEILKQMLLPDFEVHDIACKYGKIPSNKLLNEDAKGVVCNPAGQADYLEQKQTELNISMGLCIGHDMIFSSKSKAPVTTLIVKDREHKHNPIETFKILKS